MKAQKPYKSFKDYKEMLNLFESKITDIICVNPAYYLEFATVKQLLHKLSSEALRDKLWTGLEKVKKKYNDMYNQQNYIKTLTDLLNITRINIDEELGQIRSPRGMGGNSA